MTSRGRAVASGCAGILRLPCIMISLYRAPVHPRPTSQHQSRRQHSRVAPTWSLTRVWLVAIKAMELPAANNIWLSDPHPCSDG